MLDKSFIGHRLPAFDMLVESGRVNDFLRATSSLCREIPLGAPIPPTYLFCLEMMGPDPAAVRDLLSIDLGRVLHGEEHFEYEAAVYVGDHLRFEQRIADIYERRGGELDFVVRETRVLRGSRSVATLRNVTVVRNG